MERTKWTDRSFSFDFSEGLLPNILERLSGTKSRMITMTQSLSDAVASNRFDGKWSIKEQIGHLVDLEDIHLNRLKEMIERKSELSAADMANQKTEEANHNEKSIRSLIEDFSKKRNALVALLGSMDDETQIFESLHPRLGIGMRPIDVAFFTAEHDDHHLASIREILIGGAVL